MSKKNPRTEYLYEDLTYKIIGIAFNIHKELGPVHKEKVYQKALIYELRALNIPFKSEVKLDVEYKGTKVGIYRPDLIIDDKVIVEIKAVDFLPKSYESQLTYYLKGTKYKLGLLLNFGSRRLDVRRRIYDKISR